MTRRFQTSNFIFSVALIFALAGTNAANAEPSARHPRLSRVLANTLRAPHRFHLITQKFQKRLDETVQKNLLAIGHYTKPNQVNATAFVVGIEPKTRTALVMTNLHVIRSKRPDTTSVTDHKLLFYLAGAETPPIETPVIDEIASNQNYDYALVAVQLPESLSSAITPLSLSTAPIVAETPIYSSGYPDFDMLKIRRVWHRMSHHRFNQQWLRWGSHKRYPTAQIGREINQGTPRIESFASGTNRVYVFDYPSGAGTSGSPVIGKQTHQVIALNKGSNRDKEESYAIPMSDIVADLAEKLQTGAIAPQFESEVRRLIETTRAASSDRAQDALP